VGTRSRICQKGWAVWVTVVPYVENTLYSTNKYSCVRPVHTLYISYLLEHDGDDEPHDSATVPHRHTLICPTVNYKT